MIHAIAHHFEHFGIQKGSVGLEYTFLTQSMMLHAYPFRTSHREGAF
jgi:hypothetical protein